MPTTTVNGLRYPAAGAAPNVPQDIQNLATDLEGKLERIYANQGVAAGTSPTSDKTMITKGFSAVVTANVNGATTISYPGGGFPTGVATVLCTSGDTAGGHGFTVITGTALGSINCTHYQPNGSLVGSGATIRVNVIAIGW